MSCSEDSNEMRCSCLRMKSFGIPWVHLINVMVYLDIDQLPKCLVLDKWTMKAKEGITMTNVYGSELGDSCYRSRVISMNDSWRELTNIACRYLEDYNEVMEWISQRKAELWAKQEAQF